MTNEEIRAKSLELALQFMGVAFKLPLADEDALAEDEVKEINELIGRTEWISREFEKLILKKPPH